MKYCDIKKLSASTRAEKWWQGVEKKDGNKWKTLQHNGVLFPLPYEPLPSKIQLLYKNKPVKLDSLSIKNPFSITAEEAAVFFATKMEQDDRLSEKDPTRKKAVDDKKFTDNFWKDWKKILGSNHTIQNFKDVDFSPIQRYIAQRSELKKTSKKALDKEEKMAEKEQKEAVKDLYGYAVVDGIKIPLGNYMVQPPGLYIGHGNHPLRGRIKARVQPKDIVLNVSKTNVPRCFINAEPCKWGDVIEDHDVTWIAAYRHPITEEMTYVWLKREASEWVCASDMEKFEKARKLAENISKVRKQYTKDLSSSNIEIRQLATSVYLLDVIAIRPGTEKDEAKEAGTLGLTTLKCSNIKFEKDNNITIDFVGKSSIQFVKTFKVEKMAYDNLQKLCKSKGKTTQIFPNVDATSLNNYLKTLLPDLTAKVFRTYKASSILQNQLQENIPDPDDATHEKKLIYDRVNIEVAKALNHKKMGGASSERVEKLKEKIKEAKDKKKKSTTPKQKTSAQKSIDTNTAKLEEAQFNISTSTSKVNYLDPRITVSWCKKGEVPIEKIYNKTQLAKFVWAMETPADWKF
jgi:DNA topoisomerase I